MKEYGSNLEDKKPVEALTDEQWGNFCLNTGTALGYFRSGTEGHTEGMEYWNEATHGLNAEQAELVESLIRVAARYLYKLYGSGSLRTDGVESVSIQREGKDNRELRLVSDGYGNLRAADILVDVTDLNRFMKFFSRPLQGLERNHIDQENGLFQVAGEKVIMNPRRVLEFAAYVEPIKPVTTVDRVKEAMGRLGKN